MNQVIEKETFVDLKSLFDLTGKVAIVTGGAGWLGMPMCEALAELGATVCIANRDEEKATVALKSIKQNIPSAKVDAFRLDIGDRSSVESCFAEVAEKHSNVDVLINNAFAGRSKSIEEVTDDIWSETMDNALTGSLRCIQAALPYMKNAKKGTIINLSSMYGLVAPNPDLYEGNSFLNPPAYGAAKAAIIQLTKYSAVHLAKYGIRVNCISPGAFPSRTTQLDEIFIQRLSAKNPLKRIGNPQELKGAIAYLASEASSYVTGQNLIVDGGWTVW